MPIRFSQERWDQINRDYAAWWDGTLDRNLFRITVTDAHPADRAVRAPMLAQQNVHDFSYSAEDLIEAQDVRLGQCEFLGDAYPFVNFDSFGPGVLSAFCGAKLDNSSGNVWFFPNEELPISQIHVVYDPQNRWVQRIKSIFYAGIRKWGNQVSLGFPDLGGVLDIAATFRGTQNLLLDLYDDPDEVIRLCDEIEVAWYEAFDDFSAILKDAGLFFSNWAGLYSDKPAFMLQCDFSYMISNDMFRQFVLPTLARDCKRIANPAYHLDGKGELPHLDDLLNIKELKCIQWIYGDGQPSAKHWMDIYERIVRAGKRFQMIGDLDDARAITSVYKKDAYFGIDLLKKDMDEARALIAN